MKLAPVLRERIIRNFIGGDLSAEELIAILESKVAPGAQTSRTMLINLLAGGQHRNLRAHTQGSADGTVHYTVFVANRGYHLRLDRRGVIFQITDAQGSLSRVPPWVRPGSH